MSNSNEPDKCSLCSSDLEAGCVMGNIGTLTAGFRWYPGEPSAVRNALGVFVLGGEEMGECGVLKGPFMRGSRCTRCRKLFLDY